MTSGSRGFGFGSGGRHRDRFSESAKSAAAILTGVVALLVAVAGMITLVCSDPAGNPASAVTTTAVGVGDAPAGGNGGASAVGGGGGASGGGPSGNPASDTASGASSGSATASPSPGATPATSGPSGASPSSDSAAPASSPPSSTASSAGDSGSSAPSTSPSAPDYTGPMPQWEGALQVDSAGYSLASVPPSPDQSGNPDISASFDGTFVAGLGAAKWTAATGPNPQACAALIMTQDATRVTADPGDVFCVRVAHRPFKVGSQYAAVQIVEQGLDSSGSPYVRIRALVWRDGE